MDRKEWQQFKLVYPGPLTCKALEGFRQRIHKAGDLNRLKRGSKYYCKWCNEREVVGQQHYCCGSCKISAYIWLWPGRHHSREYLLAQQSYACANCWYDWGVNGFGDESREPEVDHIIAISNGGDSIGVDNLQVLCKSCHKVKTKNDRRRL